MSIWLLINKVLLDYRWACINTMGIPTEVTQHSMIFIDGLFTCEIRIRDSLETSMLNIGSAHWRALSGVPYKDRLELRNKLEIP